MLQRSQLVWDSQRACPSSPRSKFDAAEAQVKTAHRLCRLCCLTDAELLLHGLLQYTGLLSAVAGEQLKTLPWQCAQIGQLWPPACSLDLACASQHRRSRALVRGIASRGGPSTGRRTAVHQVTHRAVCWPTATIWSTAEPHLAGKELHWCPSTRFAGSMTATLLLQHARTPRASSQLQNLQMGWQENCSACCACLKASCNFLPQKRLLMPSCLQPSL